MNERTISVLKGVRTAIQVLAEPIDSLTRFMNCKKGYPPLWIRQRVGSLNDFEGSGSEYMAYLKLLCNLEPGMNVLDIGCGCGLMCLPINENGTLPEYIFPGEYVGLDVNKWLVGWCKKYIKGDNIEFTHNPLTDYKDGFFDVVLCKSLFTHLEVSEVISFVHEIKRLLKDGGRCLTTFFILNDVERKGRYRFQEWDEWNRVPVEAYDRPTNPRAAIAYALEWLKMVFDNADLSYEVYYGSWRGDNKGLSFQDIIILRK